MKFIHLSDLHLGKKMYQLSLLKDQQYILEQIMEIVRKEKPDAVILAGDIYDKIYPPAEAITLFDHFLVHLAEAGCKVFVISGNHDSPERIAFLGRLTKLAGVYLSPVYQGKLEKIRLEDEFGGVTVWLMPFIKPVHVRHFHEDATIENYTQAMEVAIGCMGIEERERNVLVAHQFVTGARISDSEERTIGGLDQVSEEVFSRFDYVALGHLHRPQWVGRPEVRYCGAPLKYSFSESQDKKSVTIVELGKKGHVVIREHLLNPQRDVIRLRGKFLDLIDQQKVTEEQRKAYVQITLLDEEDVLDAFNRLALIYPGLLHLEYDNKRTRMSREIRIKKEQSTLSPSQLVADFYEEMNNQSLQPLQLAYLEEKMKLIWKGEEEA